jgi:uncharacterized protein YndB with AHSA1/START domain
MEHIIQHQLFYPHPPETVWEYITNPDLIAQWMMKSDFKPVVGHEFTFTASPMPDMNFDGIFHCKVLSVEPHKKLSYSWQFGPGDGTLTNSTVTWTLTEKNNGTQLSLEHDRFKGEGFLKMFESMSKGWLTLMNKLITLLTDKANGTTHA